MTDAIEIQPAGPVRGSVRPPGSKSITNRALVCAALADGESLLTEALDSEDTRVMIGALGRLGVVVDHDRAGRTIRLVGCGGRPPAPTAELYVANSGTTMRFLTAVAALGEGTFRLDGTPRMRQRPIEDLLEALRQVGADARSESQNGCPPVVVRAHGLRGGRATVAGNVSSQFLSGLLMAAPCASGPVELDVSGELVSKPYVKMTLALMSAFGVEAGAEPFDWASPEISARSAPYDGLPKPPTETRFLIAAGQKYRARRYEIEPDASAASYFFAAAAVTRGEVTIRGLTRDSLQGDMAFCELLARMGCDVHYGPDATTVAGKPLRGIDADMNAISDTVPTLCAVALFAEGPTTIRSVAHIRHKETDRLTALATELRKLGAEVRQRPGGLKIVPGRLRPARIDTYDDHRMAMSFAVVGLGNPGVVICQPGCTAKTYPEFFRDLANLVR